MDEILFEEFDYRALCRISGTFGMASFLKVCACCLTSQYKHHFWK